MQTCNKKGNSFLICGLLPLFTARQRKSTQQHVGVLTAVLNDLQHFYKHFWLGHLWIAKDNSKADVKRSICYSTDVNNLGTVKLS